MLFLNFLRGRLKSLRFKDKHRGADFWTNDDDDEKPQKTAEKKKHGSPGNPKKCRVHIRKEKKGK